VNELKRVSYAGCVTLFKTRQSHAARFSFMPEVTGLKTHRGPKRKEQIGACSIHGFPSDRGSMVLIMGLL
jgi:hypothetical protein